MDRDSFILIGLVVLVIAVVVVLVVAFSGNNTFQMGTVSFEYPKSYSQSSPVGNFGNNSLYGEVSFTANYANPNGTSQPSFIIFQMQQKTSGIVNLPNTAATNTSNATVSTLNVDNRTATQIGTLSSNAAEKTTIIQNNNYYIIVTFISPLYAANQTSKDYNLILQTLQIS